MVGDWGSGGTGGAVRGVEIVRPDGTNRFQRDCRPARPSSRQRFGGEAARAQPRNEGQAADPQRHQRADRRPSPPRNELAADERGDGDAAEQRGSTRAIAGQPDPLDRAAAARAAARGRPIGVAPARAAGHGPTASRYSAMSSPAIGAATSRAAAALLDEDRDRDLRVVGRREADEPRVRLAVPPSSAVPDLPAVDDARDLGAGREQPAERRPRPPRPSPP